MRARFTIAVLGTISDRGPANHVISSILNCPFYRYKSAISKSNRMKYYEKMKNCLHCNSYVDKKVCKQSKTKYDFELCEECQQKLISSNKGSIEATRLYLSLRKRHVPAELEKFNGYKTIDIAIVDAKVNIEVEGPHHQFKYKQALTDLKQTLYSFQDGFLTLRIPNVLIKKNLEETANCVTELIMRNKSLHLS